MYPLVASSGSTMSCAPRATASCSATRMRCRLPSTSPRMTRGEVAARRKDRFTRWGALCDLVMRGRGECGSVVFSGRDHHADRREVAVRVDHPVGVAGGVDDLRGPFQVDPVVAGVDDEQLAGTGIVGLDAAEFPPGALGNRERVGGADLDGGGRIAVQRDRPAAGFDEQDLRLVVAV